MSTPEEIAEGIADEFIIGGTPRKTLIDTIAAALRKIEAERNEYKAQVEELNKGESREWVKSDTLDRLQAERDRLAKEVEKLRAALVEIGEHDSVDTSSFVFQTAYAALDRSTPEGGKP